MGFENIKENEQPGVELGFESADIDLDSDELSGLQTVRAVRRTGRPAPEMKTGMKRDRMGRREYNDDTDVGDGAELIAPDKPIRIAGGRRPMSEQRTQPFTSENAEYAELFARDDTEERTADRARFGRLDGLAYDERHDGDGAQFAHIFDDQSAVPMVHRGENMVQELMRERRMEDEEQRRQLRGISESRPTGLVEEQRAAVQEPKRERSRFSRRERKREEAPAAVVPAPAEKPAEKKKDAAKGKDKRTEGAKRMDKNNTHGNVRMDNDRGVMPQGQPMPQVPYGAPMPPYGYAQPGYAPYGAPMPPYGYAYPQPPYPYAPMPPYGYAYPQQAYPYGAPMPPYGYAYPQPPYPYAPMPGMMPVDVPYNGDGEYIPDVPMIAEAPAEPKPEPAKIESKPEPKPAEQPAKAKEEPKPEPAPVAEPVKPEQPEVKTEVPAAQPDSAEAQPGGSSRFNRRSRAGGERPAAQPEEQLPTDADIDAQLSALSRHQKGESYTEETPRFTPRRRNAPLTAEELSTPTSRFAEDDDVNASLSRMTRRNRSGAPE